MGTPAPIHHPPSARAWPALAAAALLSLSAPSNGQTQASAPRPIVEAPFERLEDSGPDGYTLLSFPRRAHTLFDRAHAAAGLTELRGLPLPGGADVDLLLRPVSVWEADGRALVMAADGSQYELAPSVRLFGVHSVDGTVSGFVGLSADMLHGYFDLAGERYVLSTGATPGNHLAVSRENALAGLGDGTFCNVLADVRAVEEPQAAEPDGSSAANPKLRTTRVFMECDKRFRDRFSSTQDVIDYATLLVGATSEIYRRDLGVTLNMPNNYLRVWESTLPWGNTSTFGDLSKFISW